jgi:multidrug transporter EmrE-like cation transporter
MNKFVLLWSALYAVFNVSGAAIIKTKLLEHKIVAVKDFLWFLLDWKIMGAMVFIFVSMFFSIKALSLAKFSNVIPVMTGINFMITVSVGLLYFKDRISLWGYTGIILIIIGIYLITKDQANLT